MKKAHILFILTFLIISNLFSQNTVSVGNTWYKINSKGKFVTQIRAWGYYSEHDVITHIINQHWSTSELTYISEFNYNHFRIKLEWGKVGSGANQFLTVRVVPVTANYASGFEFKDVNDPSFDYGLTAVDASLVTPITPKNQLFIDEWTGKIGIGTTTPDSKLTVAGNIHAQEVKVTINAGADFVFKDDYNLPDLKDLEAFIKTNKHLPEIASEKEMQEKGVLLAEMNIKLLQKIEELTLYTIKQQKHIEKQSETLKLQSEIIKEIQEKLKKE